MQFIKEAEVRLSSCPSRYPNPFQCPSAAGGKLEKFVLLAFRVTQWSPGLPLLLLSPNLKMRLSSMAPPENQGFVARHVSSALSFSDVTFRVRMLVVILPSCEVEKGIKDGDYKLTAIKCGK